MPTTSLFKPEALAIRAPLQLRNVETTILAMTYEDNVPDVGKRHIASLYQPLDIETHVLQCLGLARAGVLVRLVNSLVAASRNERYWTYRGDAPRWDKKCKQN